MTADEPEGNKPEPTAPTSSNARTRKTSFIGPTLKIKGELSAYEDLIIEEVIEGTIAHQNKNLSVGKEGGVTADIDARTVEVYGWIEGGTNLENTVLSGRISCTDH